MSGPSASSVPGASNPVLSMALAYLSRMNPETRTEWANIVCETLGVRPNFWQRESEGATPPVNVLCALKVGTHQNGVRVVLGTHDGTTWRAVADSSPVTEVQQFGLIPD